MEKIKIGQKFGFLTVVKHDTSEYRKNRFKNAWICKCECGNIRTFAPSELLTGHNYSCGCKAGKGNLKTGISTTIFYKKWDGIKRRCYRKSSDNYKQYGGRGIRVEWKSFEDFKRDMYDSYLKHREEHGDENTTLDRIDVNGNYCKENCRWATQKEQGRNRRNNVYVNYKGEKIVASIFLELTGIEKSEMYKKIKLGWSGEEILNKLKK